MTIDASKKISKSSKSSFRKGIPFPASVSNTVVKRESPTTGAGHRQKIYLHQCHQNQQSQKLTANSLKLNNRAHRDRNGVSFCSLAQSTVHSANKNRTPGLELFLKHLLQKAFYCCTLMIETVRL